MLKIMGKAQASGRNYGQKIISNLHFLRKILYHLGICELLYNSD